MSNYYPMMVRLNGKKCIVVGGGKVAERKLAGLLEAGADNVAVISPVITPKLEELAAASLIRWDKRPYNGLDAGVFLVIAATDDREVNKRVAADAERLEALVNVADAPEEGRFITPAVVRRGSLLLAVTAGGASPSLTVRIKRELEARYGPDYAAYTEKLARLRLLVQQTVADEMDKKDILQRAALEMPPFAVEENADEWLARLTRKTEG
ncbi:precorrin-2 dehydrogenase/sirohydrochlorin ferrochelatase family protein [Paenibacillus protaetiae]|uniref:precorrin-2 dehydrogenase n=1 Tax=Paenibacillus protaetiae TaxID=2509456 RepID=A0A4P6F427_9BACL|nr:NAD(P)-dependent oxidoreductase [Paenibacillus protaetiae]QAY65148.1 hypothetical protein ET464_00855 [Paenibacillus protaetiae]